MKPFSQRVRQITPSATLAIDAQYKQMLKEGKDVVGFGAGEPDFDTPDNIKQAAFAAIKKGQTKYTAVSGINELKDAIATKLKRENHLDYSREDIVVSCGGKHALMNVCYALLNPGDEVILPVPYWVTYEEQIHLAEAKAVLCPTEKLQIKARLIEEAITPKTKAIMLNSPCNPTGSVIEHAELKKIAKLAADKEIFVISDDVYEHFIYSDEEHVSIASLGEDIRRYTIIVNSLSKTYSMTGWRVGYTASTKELASLMGNLQSHQTSNPTSIAQWAAVEALNGPQDSVQLMKKAFGERRKFIVKRLNEMPNVSCLMPAGAFYVFPDISQTGMTSMRFCERLLKEANVAVVPGAAFGDDKHIRLSYACSLENIAKGMDRMETFLKQHGQP
ncbi:pyridoxal phosphate-dependent aminotransferase [Candidatus Woesearchaeota archaeon]|nr:pyridoxal phosphate-dependent aminotransferase [Candidatus Woesearchaeota archaeon]